MVLARSSWLGTVLFFLAYLAGAEVGYYLSFPGQPFATFWPPSGLFVAALLRSDRRRWPALLATAILAEVTVDLWNNQTLATSLAFGAANCLEALIGASLLRHWCGTNMTLSRLKEVVALAAVAALATAVSATLAAGVTVTFQGQISFWTAWRLWWTSSVLGWIVVAPLLLTGLGQDWPSWAASWLQRYLEAIALFGGLGVLTALVFGQQASYYTSPRFVLLPLLLIAALRFGPRGAALAGVMLALLAVGGTVRGLGPFAAPGISVGGQALALQGYLSVHNLSILLLAAVLAEREHAKEALRQSQEFISSIAEASPHIMYVFNIRERQLVYMNRLVARDLGYSSDEIQHMGSDLFTRLMHPDDFQRLPELLGRWGRAADHQVLEAEFRIRHVDGSWHCFIGRETVFRRASDGTVLEIIGTAQDITARKATEQALAESERRLRLFFEHVPAPVALVDRNLRYLLVSRRWVTDYRLGDKDLVGRNHYEVFPEIPRRWKEVVRRCLDGASDHCDEDPFPRADGTLDWVRWEVLPWTDANGEIGGLVMFTEVITERKQAEEAARRAQEELLQRQVHEKQLVEAQLNRVLDEWVRSTRLATIGKVAASIAHDLRNGLGAIRNVAYLLRRRLPPDDPKAAEYLGILDQEVATSDRIINNLLETARPKEPIKEVLDLGELVRAVVTRIELPPEVACECPAPPEPIRVPADRVQLRQVLDNLLHNALDAVGQRGVIQVDIRADDRFADIVVSDNGPGVAPVHRQSLFEPLFSTKARGTGLGLWICRQMVERHGGTVELLDHDGSGATFRVRLPRHGAGIPPPDRNGGPVVPAER